MADRFLRCHDDSNPVHLYSGSLGRNDSSKTLIVHGSVYANEFESSSNHLSGKGLLRFLADSGARFEVILHRLMKGFTQTPDGFRVEADTIANADDLTGKDAVIVVMDAGRITLLRHGLTPIRSRNARAARV